MLTADMTPVHELARDLGRVANSRFDDVVDAVHDAAWYATEVAKARAAGTRWKRVGASWTYERSSTIGQIAFETGPDRDKDPAAGLLGAYLGWPNGGGGVLDIEAPVREAERPLMAALDAALEKLL